MRVMVCRGGGGGRHSKHYTGAITAWEAIRRCWEKRINAGLIEVRAACMYRQQLGYPKPATVPGSGQEQRQAHEAHSIRKESATEEAGVAS